MLLATCFEWQLICAPTNWNQNGLSIKRINFAEAFVECTTLFPRIHESQLSLSRSLSVYNLPSMWTWWFSVQCKRLNVTKHFACEIKRVSWQQNDETFAYVMQSISWFGLYAYRNSNDNWLEDVTWLTLLALLINIAIATCYNYAIHSFFGIVSFCSWKLFSLLLLWLATGFLSQSWNIISQLMSMCQSSKSRGVQYWKLN